MSQKRVSPSPRPMTSTTLSAPGIAVHLACAEIEEDGMVSNATWNTLADAVGPGYLLVVVESSRE